MEKKPTIKRVRKRFDVLSQNLDVFEPWEYPLISNPHVITARNINSAIDALKREVKYALEQASKDTDYVKGQYGKYDGFLHRIESIKITDTGSISLCIQRVKKDGTDHPSYSKHVPHSHFISEKCECGDFADYLLRGQGACCTKCKVR